MNKKWYMSKTMWAAVVMAIVAVLQAIGVPIPNQVYAVLTALGFAGLRVAKG